MSHKKNNQSGYTLVEMLVVIGIIGLLAVAGMVAMNSAKHKAKVAKAQEELRQIYQAIAQLEIDSEAWPGHKTPIVSGCGTEGNEICPDGCTYGLDDCRAGLVCTDGNYVHWKGPYINPMPLDPWGVQYFFDTDYTTDGRCVVVIGSYGPNRVGNNLYDEDDILFIIPTK